MDGIEDGSLEAREQSGDGLSLAPKVLVEEAEVDWSTPAVADRSDDPGLHARPRRLDHARRRAGQGRTGLTARGGRSTSRRARSSIGKNHVDVGTGTGSVRLGEVKAFGKKQMPAAAWARGVRLEAGARFGS